MLSDIEIAQAAKPLPIAKIAEQLGILSDELECYGNYKAKITQSAFSRTADRPDGKLILVTAINPTPAGEGKTTTTVALGQAMKHIGKNAVIALREPSLGPVFGIKGGAAGGGYSQVIPMEDINLHFTGDIHAVTAANNLLCALIDNHINHGNALRLDSRRISFRRCMDMNDRALREIIVGIGGKANGFMRSDGFNITAASEVMAVLCLCADIDDLKKRLGDILVGYDLDSNAVFCRQLNAQGAMAALLKDAVNPNLVQTLEGTPCLMHGGPFANIAHGCNSARATKLGLKLADYCITEAGFGADLGAQKFFDIKCRAAGLTPSAAVLVATVRALKHNAGIAKAELCIENVEATEQGGVNLAAHIANLKKYGLPVVVAVNRFPTDTPAEIAAVVRIAEQNGADCAVSDGFFEGGKGAALLAEKVAAAADRGGDFKPLCADEMTVTEKIGRIAREIYGADEVTYEDSAFRRLEEIRALGFGASPVCVAKTQYSLSDDPKKLGRPKNFKLTVRDLRLCAGAGFVVALTGDIMTMPGLPKTPAANAIDIDGNGLISGLF
ncbi:MAG TPA: formate--tetrahydrofolate ligase [Oscillospiraceae bacterium]|nr:formate--tetrahydrofolate ligase [Oscillospiraceae bacterium]HPS34705.1 formate--tetrahydrofolate ligase [Oscillospiraceae bacterium]